MRAELRASGASGPHPCAIIVKQAASPVRYHCQAMLLLTSIIASNCKASKPHPCAIMLSETDRRNRPRGGVVSKWTVHAYHFHKILIFTYANFQEFPEISDDFDELFSSARVP